jgi:hypothetical protein
MEDPRENEKGKEGIHHLDTDKLKEYRIGKAERAYYIPEFLSAEEEQELVMQV